MKANQIMTAKFFISRVREDNGQVELQLLPVTSDSEENKSYSKFTPAGRIEMVITEGTGAYETLKLLTNGFTEVLQPIYIDFFSDGQNITVIHEVENGPGPDLHEEMKEVAQVPLTLGMQIVGIDFNPSGNESVNRLKQLAAEMIDIVDQHHNNNAESTYVSNLIRGGALKAILEAQMMAVKSVTNVY